MSKQKIVLDTNIFVSALLSPYSKAWQTIHYIEEHGIILYSDMTLQELQQVLNRSKFKKYITQEEIQKFLIKFVEKFSRILITQTITICRDPKDNKFLELAVSGKADLIITGDQDLLVLNPFRNIEIITITEFLARFTEN